MIDHVTSETIAAAYGCHGAPCVSMYLPTHRAGPETDQDPIRFRNVLDTARRRLVDHGMRGPAADELLAPAAALLDDEGFWRHLDEGLAVLIHDDGTDWYRLPQSVDEVVIVGEYLHVRPLLRAVDASSEFYVLALSRNDIRLLRGSRARIHEIALRDVSTSLAEALWYRDDEKVLQNHAAGRVGRGRVTATFHGHGAPKDTSAEDLATFLRAVDAGVAEIIGDDAAPVILAGVHRIQAAYRSVSALDTIEATGVEGNPDDLSPAQLHERAWPIAERRLADLRREVAETIEAKSPPTVTTPEDAVAMAHQGRVATLFVTVDSHLFGRFDASTGEIAVHDRVEPGDSDLFDLAALLTWRNGGDVHVVDGPEEVPGPGEVSAVLRF